MSIAALGSRPPVFITACVVVLLSLEGYAVFIDRDRVFAIEGKNAYEIAEFGDGVVVSHSFLMSGDGLHTVRVQLNTDRPAALNFRWVLWSGTPDLPAQMARAFDGMESIDVYPGREWHSLRFPRNGSSNDRWFTIELQMLGSSPGVTGSSRPRISLVASRDNPHRGGILWVGDARQPGSLYLRAESTWRTVHRRFLTEAVPHLPRALQLPLVQWTAFALLHWAFVVFAYAVIIDGENRK